MKRLGLDIGGTKIECAVLDDQGVTVYRQRIATDKSSYQAFVTTVIGVIAQAETALQEPLSVGIGLPGTEDPQTGLIKNSNILVLNQQPLGQTLSGALQRPVSITNDANCFTLSEAIDGSGAEAQVVFGVILGTGCGGGLVVNQQMIRSRNACSGEWGHNPLPGYDPRQDGPAAPCYCGRCNCIESFISGTGLERQYIRKYSKQISAPAIIDQLRAGESQAQALWQIFMDQLARALGSIVNMIDPDVIVLGGGLSNIAEIYPDLRQRVTEYVFGNRCTTPILPARHGDSGGVRGAAWSGIKY